MKVISFDVGIKNMAYCILEYTTDDIFINNWGVLNMMEDENITHNCECMNKAKNKKTAPKECTKKAKYHKNNKYYCEKHAKECSQYIIPTKAMTAPSLKKLKLDDLIQQGNKNLIFLNVENLNSLKKVDVLNIVIEFYKKHCFEVIIDSKKKTAGETDLISVGRKMKEQLNKIENINEIQRSDRKSDITDSNTYENRPRDVSTIFYND